MLRMMNLLKSLIYVDLNINSLFICVCRCVFATLGYTYLNISRNQIFLDKIKILREFRLNYVKKFYIFM